MKTKRSNPRRISTIKAYCLGCWHKHLYFDIEWSELANKTSEELRILCNSMHIKTCDVSNVRLYNYAAPTD